MDDPAFEAKGGWDRKGVSRVVLCSGKVYYELAERRKAIGRKDIALIRLEQLYPFHQQMAKEILSRYPKNVEMVYAQEEPRNAGAFLFVSDLFRSSMGIDLRYIGREPSATPAVGSKHADLIQQEAVIAAAIGPVPAAETKTEKRDEKPSALTKPGRDAPMAQPAR